MICIVMVSAFTAFGQSVVSGSTDADNNGNPEPFRPILPPIRIPARPKSRFHRLLRQMLKTNLPLPLRRLLFRNRATKRKSGKM